jgi:hypothetical protein
MGGAIGLISSLQFRAGESSLVQLVCYISSLFYITLQTVSEPDI